MLAARPGYTLVAVGCLGLGIGVNIALFGVVDALLLRPPAGVAEPESLVRVRIRSNPRSLAGGAGPTANYDQYRRIAEERADILSGLAAYGRRDGTLDGGPGASPVVMTAVTTNYFSVLGVRPRLGRFFDTSRGERGRGAGMAVLSHRMWEQAYGADQGIVGRSIRVNSVPLTIVGIVPKRFVGVDLGDPDLWIPMGLVALPEFGGDGSMPPLREYWLQFVGRLWSGVSLLQANGMAPTESIAPFTVLPFAEPSSLGSGGPIPVSFLPLRTMFFENQQGRNPVPLWALGISAALLLLACGTVANLLLAQAVERETDIAIRLAVGGSPGLILREQILGSLLLALMSLVVATALASLSIALVHKLPIPPIPNVVNGRSVTLGLGLALLTPLVFGVAPAVWAARREVGVALKEYGGGITAPSRLQNRLMAGQTAIAFVLVLIAGLFLRSLLNARRIDTGMDLERVAVIYTDDRWRIADDTDLVTVALDRLGFLPSVETAAVGSIVPFYMLTRRGFQIADGRPDEAQPGSVLSNSVGPDYFRALGIGLVGGRLFDEQDRPDSSPVAIVSERLVREAWAGNSPIGQCIRVPHAFGDACVQVIGVAADVRYEGLLTEPSAVLYLPEGQVPGPLGTPAIFVRTGQDTGGALQSIRSEIQALHSSMPFVRVEPLGARLRPQLMRWEVATKLFTVLGVMAGLLGAGGLYMVVTFNVSQRTRELGIRSSLGAQPHHLLCMVLLEGLKVAGVGILLGTILGAAVAALFGNQFVGLTYTDVPTYLAVASVMILVAVTACLRPAAAAAAADPVVALGSHRRHREGR